MFIDIYVTTEGPYKVEFLNSDYSQMNNPYIAPQLSMAPVSGLLHIPAPVGIYTIPVIKLTNLKDGIVSIAYAYPVHCGPIPTPTPIATPTPTPTPIYIPPAPTPVVACSDCRLYEITPTGFGLGADWTVHYMDCANISQSVSGDGTSTPIQRYMCSGSISVVGEARVDTVVSTPTPVSPTPVSPTPTPVAPVRDERVESTRFQVSKNGFLYTDISAPTPNGYTSYYFVEEFLLQNSSGQPLPFVNVDLSAMAGEMIMCRRLILKNSTFPNYQTFESIGYLANIPDTTGNIHNDFGNSQILLIP